MIEWIVSLIPWWLWAIVAVVVLGAVHRLAGGWRNMLIAATALGAVLMFKRGQHVGETREQKKAAKDAEKAIKRADKVRNRVNARNSDPQRLRENDGFKRSD